MEVGQLWRQFFIASFANLAVTSIGYSLGWTSPVNLKLKDPELSPLETAITIDEEAWIGSLISIGAILGPFIAGFVAAKIGRKWGLLSSAVPLLLGWVLIAVATNVALIYSGRIAWGIAVGMLFTLSPMYCAEIATDDSRGALGSLLQVFLNLGFLLVYSVGPYVSYLAIAYVGIAITVFFVIIFFFMPETPIYCLYKNDKEGAAKALCVIRGRSRAGIESELEKIEATVQASMAKTATIADLFKGSNFKAFYISCTLLFFQQLSGANAVLFYMANIFEAAGATLDASISTIIIAAVQGLLGVYFILEENENPVTEKLGFLPIVSLILYLVTFGWGLGPMPWAILGELLPIEVKVVAAPIATAFCWTLSFLVTRYFSPLANVVGMAVTFWIFGVFCVAGFFFTLFLVPETKGKSFLEIQDMLAGKKSKSEKA